MWTGILLKRGASRSRSALAVFSTSRRGVSGLLSDPAAAAAAAASPSSSGPFLYSNRRGQVHHFSNFADANGKRPFLIDTSNLVKGLEAHEMPPKQAEVIAEILKDGLERAALPFPWKGETEKEHFTCIMQRETEKLLRDNEKHIAFSRSEIRIANEKLRVDTERIVRELRRTTRKPLDGLYVANEKLRSDSLVYNEKMQGECRCEQELVTSRSRNIFSELRVELEKKVSTTKSENGVLRVWLEDAKYTALKYFIGNLGLVAVVVLGACFSVFLLFVS